MSEESLMDRIRRELKRLLGRTTSKEGAREKVLETWKYSKRLAEELKRELFGDSLFLETVIVSLILLSVLTLLADFFFPLGSAKARSIYMLDLAICILLGIEFLYRLINSRDPSGFLSKYWYELIALTPAWLTALISVPILAAILRLLRLIRVYRVYKVLGPENIYLHMIIDIVKEARIMQLLTIFLIGLGFTSVIAFIAEARAPNSSIQSLSDAFWWSLATVTTVGYGDIVPVTAAGKVVGVVLMLFGIAVLGGFISLTSASVMRVLSHYQEIMRERVIQDEYARFRYMASRISELSDGEYEEFLELAKKLRSTGVSKE